MVVVVVAVGIALRRMDAVMRQSAVEQETRAYRRRMLAGVAEAEAKWDSEREIDGTSPEWNSRRHTGSGSRRGRAM